MKIIVAKITGACLIVFSQGSRFIMAGKGKAKGIPAGGAQIAAKPPATSERVKGK